MLETEMNNNEPSAIKDLTRYVEENLVSAVDGRRCVDGRYSDEEGTIARAGADGGYVLILLNLKKKGKIQLSARECVDAVKGAVEEKGGKLMFHTDSHGKIGCGHINQAANPREEDEYQGYGVDPADVAEAWAYMEELASTGLAKEITLEGAHQEEGVLRIKGKTWTVKPKNNQKMYFVYDETRDMEFMENLVQRMNIDGLDIEDFKAVSNDQTGATLHNLANGKPIYDINTDAAAIKPEFAGFVS